MSLHLRVGFLWNEGVEKVIPQFSADAKPCRGRQTGQGMRCWQKRRQTFPWGGRAGEDSAPRDQGPNTCVRPVSGLPWLPVIPGPPLAPPASFPLPCWDKSSPMPGVVPGMPASLTADTAFFSFGLSSGDACRNLFLELHYLGCPCQCGNSENHLTNKSWECG